MSVVKWCLGACHGHYLHKFIVVVVTCTRHSKGESGQHPFMDGENSYETTAFPEKLLSGKGC